MCKKNCSLKNNQADLLPKHIAIIMDGNGRWAKKRFLPRIVGHKKAISSVRAVVEASVEKKIQALTLFAFSTENWKRPKKEVDALMNLFLTVLAKEVEDLHKNNVRLTFIGDRERLSKKLQELILSSENYTKENTGLRLNIAVSYGGRWDIVNACKNIAKKVKSNLINEDEINEELFEQYLELSDQPDCDLLIRTSNEHRISNFLIWKLSYAEIYFSNIFWPDFKRQDFENALDFFAKRERRYGLISEQIKEKNEQDELDEQNEVNEPNEQEVISYVTE